jgi:hypothetical protein
MHTGLGKFFVMFIQKYLKQREIIYQCAVYPGLGYDGLLLTGCI